MPAYGYIRTSRDQNPSHPGGAPEVQCRQLADAGVEPGRIYADVAVSGVTPGSSRAQCHLLDQLLSSGDVLVVAAIDRLVRYYLETMWAIYDLQGRGVRLRSLNCNQRECTKLRYARPDSPEAFMGNILASMAAYVASQERQNISQRTRAGLDAARAKGRELGRPGGSPTSNSPPFAGTWRTRCPWPRWPGNTGCSDPRSVLPCPDGVKLLRATPSSRKPGPAQSWKWPRWA